MGCCIDDVVLVGVGDDDAGTDSEVLVGCIVEIAEDEDSVEKSMIDEISVDADDSGVEPLVVER